MAKGGADWEAIRAEYVTGGATYAELAEKYHVSPNTLAKKASKEGWKKSRQKAGEIVTKKLENRAARAREEKALKGIHLTKYITDLWTDNLKALNEMIKNTPEYMLSNPNFASGIPRGLRETYDLIMEMSGKGYVNRKLANEQRKLKMEREKFEFEKRKWEEEMRQKEAAQSRMTGEGEPAWAIMEDDEEVESISG